MDVQVRILFWAQMARARLALEGLKSPKTLVFWGFFVVAPNQLKL